MKSTCGRTSIAAAAIQGSGSVAWTPIADSRRGSPGGAGGSTIFRRGCTLAAPAISFTIRPARRAGRQRVGARVVAQIGPMLGHNDPSRRLPPGRTLPGTLAHFLLDRYVLYAQRNNGPLHQARVHHVPYAVEEARLLRCDETLLAASGIRVDEPPCHVAFCERREVEVFPLRRV